MLTTNFNDVDNNNYCVNKFVKNKVANNVKKMNNNIVENIFEFII